MVEHTESMLESWRDGEVRDPHEDMRQLTLAIVAKTLFGTELAGKADIVGESVEIVTKHFMSPTRWFRFFDYLPLPSPRWYWQASRQIDEIIYGIIWRHRESRHEQDDLLSRLLAARDDQGTGGMSDRQLRDEVVTLILAGHETTSLVLFYTFYLLAQSPECADRLAAELREVVGDRAPTAGDVSNLRYTEWVVREFAMMEAVLLLATIARRYQLQIEPGQTLLVMPSITLRPRHSFYVRLKANRHQTAQAATEKPQTFSHAPTNCKSPNSSSGE